MTFAFLLYQFSFSVSVPCRSVERDIMKSWENLFHSFQGTPYKYKIWEEDQAISLYKDKNDCLNHNSLWKWSTQKTQDQRLWRHGVRSWRHLTKKIYSTLRKVLCAMINCINLWLPYQAMIYLKLWVIAFTNNSKPRRTFSLKRVNSLPYGKNFSKISLKVSSLTSPLGHSWIPN